MGWLVLAATLVSCDSRKADLCARIHTVLLAQTRALDEIPEHLRRPEQCDTQAQRLRERVAELRALEVHDARLAEALGRYTQDVETLADAYTRVAAVHRSRPDGAVDASTGELVSLGAQLMVHAQAVDQTGHALRQFCDGT
jgi:hypothetical protein